MKCAVHPEVDATGYCRNCGKALCPACTRNVQGMVYCEPCLGAMLTQQPVQMSGPKPALEAREPRTSIEQQEGVPRPGRGIAH